MEKLLENKIFKICSSIIEWIIIIVLFLLVILVGVQKFSNRGNFFGYRIYTIISGSMIPTYDVGDKETADQYCSLFKLMEDKEKGIEVSCSGTKVTIKGFAKIDDEDEKMIGMSKEEFLKKAQEENMTCK